MDINLLNGQHHGTSLQKEYFITGMEKIIQRKIKDLTGVYTLNPDEATNKTI
jgi:hypothetical protein